MSSSRRPSSLELFYAPTPNGWKITILLHEAGIPYTLRPIDIGAGEQFSPEFQKISPNGRMPAIRVKWDGKGVGDAGDPKSESGTGEELCVFESGAIMHTLAELYPEEIAAPFYPGFGNRNDLRLRTATIEWLFWVNANLGPVAGQVSHFFYYAPRLSSANYDHSYALARYKAEYKRLISVLDRRVGETEGYLVGKTEYSVADMAAWPWVKPFSLWFKDEATSLKAAGYPYAHRWFEELKNRPKLRSGVDVLRDVGRAQQQHRESKDKDSMSAEVKENLFGYKEVRSSKSKL